MIFEFSLSEREILKTYRSSSLGKKDYIRSTVLLSLSQGKATKELYEILGIDLSSIYKLHKKIIIILTFLVLFLLII